MNNRRKIEQFCKKHNIEIISLTCKNHSQQMYGHGCPYWTLRGWYHDAEIYVDSVDKADTVSESVDMMLADMEEDLNDPERGFWTGITR